MSSAVAGYKQTLGADAPPCSYEDIAQAGVILIAGANPAVAHPIVFRQIEDARAANPDLKIIVVDPRRTETAEIADLHLPIRPGTDIALFNGLLDVLIAEGRVDQDYVAAHTSGFPALAGIAEKYTPAVVAEICGIAAADIVKAARWFAGSGPALSLYCQGLNQSAHGTHNNAGIIHLHLATGQIGKPGAGPFSLTGQPNAMGGREVGGLANLLSAHRDLANPAHSLPNQAAVRAALQSADYVVLQEVCANTDTAKFADLLLPATTWGEKEGTVTNSERRITRVRAAVAAPGEARHDWQIAVDFARRLGCKLERADVGRLFTYADAEAIFNEHRATTRGRDLEITGLSYGLLESRGPQQWPFPEGATQGRVRLYVDDRFPTADGRARFVAIEHLPTADAPSPELPISLLSGRLRDHWHGMSRTGTVPRLFNLEDEPLLAMHPCDMRHRGLEDGDLARVANARGALTVRVIAGTGLQRGRAWMPMHWGSRFMNSPGVNAVACAATDPYSQQPELKHAAVQISKCILPYPLAIVRRCSSRAEALALQHQARALLASFPYATLGLYGRSSPLVVFRAATEAPLASARLAELDALFGLASDDGAIAKRAIARDGRLLGVRLAGEAHAQAWLKQAMAEDELDASLIRLALAPSARPLVSVAPRNIVCKCADVSGIQIRKALAGGSTLAGLQEKLKCGTFCGGCLPDIRRLATKFTSKETSPA